jgi:hypothetical protein
MISVVFLGPQQFVLLYMIVLCFGVNIAVIGKVAVEWLGVA